MVGTRDFRSPHRLLFRMPHRAVTPGSASPLAASAAVIMSAALSDRWLLGGQQPFPRCEP